MNDVVEVYKNCFIKNTIIPMQKGRNNATSHFSKSDLFSAISFLTIAMSSLVAKCCCWLSNLFFTSFSIKVVNFYASFYPIFILKILFKSILLIEIDNYFNLYREKKYEMLQ